MLALGKLLMRGRISSLALPGLRLMSAGETEAKDYYDVLGLDPSATEEEVKLAYRKLAKLYHPDINATGGTHEPNADKFREVAEAYAVLSHYESRLRYNNARSKLLEKGTAPGSVEIHE